MFFPGFYLIHGPPAHRPTDHRPNDSNKNTAGKTQLYFGILSKKSTGFRKTQTEESIIFTCSKGLNRL